MQTTILPGPDKISGFLDGIAADFARIEFEPYLYNELDEIADLEASYFAASTAPDGTPWKPNASSTIRQKGHSIILRGKRGVRPTNVKATKRRPAVRFSRQSVTSEFRLARSLTLKSHQSYDEAIREAVGTAGGGKLRFGTFVPYSGYNDQGTRRIPARPHVGLNDQYLDGAAGRAADFTIRQLAK